jgi:ubiquinone biosynthesis monooxygenase Coq6
MMAIVDKLHKLYSTTAEPVVWARSAGLEVVNELDWIKAAVMGVAGARKFNPPSSFSSGGQAWNLAGISTEILAHGARAAEMVGGVAAGILKQGLERFTKR